MKKIPPKISTVESLQRRLDDMELDSAIIPSMNSSINDMFLSINEKAEQDRDLTDAALQSTTYAALQGTGNNKAKKQVTFSPQNVGNVQENVQENVTVTDRDRRLVDTSTREIKRLWHNIRRKEQFGNRMYGGNPPKEDNQTEDSVTQFSNISVNSSATSKFMTLASVSSSTIGQPSKPRQFQSEWKLGQELFNEGTFRLETLFAEHAHIGCSICSGFGHSKSKCLTNTAIQLVIKKQPVLLGIQSSALGILKQKKGVYSQWLYGDLLVNGTAKQRKEASTDSPEDRNIQVLCSMFTNEMIDFYSKKCLYCEGWGHLGTESVTVKLGKRSFAPPEAKKEQIGKYTFARYDGHCPTKESLELAMVGFPHYRSNFVTVMRRVRHEVGEQYQRKRDQHIKERQTEPIWLENSHDIAQYYNAHLVYISSTDKKVQNPNSGAIEYPKDIAFKNQTQRAVDFEKICLEREPIYLNLPTTDKEAEHQNDNEDAEKQLITENQIEFQDDIPVQERAKIKLKIFKSNWVLYNIPTAQPEFVIGLEQISIPGFFPYIRTKRRNKGIIIPIIAQLVNKLQSVIKDFAGFKADFWKDLPDDNSLGNFHYTCLRNTQMTLAALFVDKDAYEKAMHFANYLVSQVGTLETPKDIALGALKLEKIKKEYAESISDKEIQFLMPKKQHFPVIAAVYRKRAMIVRRVNEEKQQKILKRQQERDAAIEKAALKDAQELLDEEEEQRQNKQGDSHMKLSNQDDLLLQSTNLVQVASPEVKVKNDTDSDNLEEEEKQNDATK